MFDMYNFSKYLLRCILFLFMIAYFLGNAVLSQPVGLENAKDDLQKVQKSNPKTKIPTSATNKILSPSPTPSQAVNVLNPTINTNISENKEKKEAVEKEEDDAKDLIKNFKLIAVYLIANEPRALIKNLANPDEAPREFRVGDFIDDLQKLSVSRIAFNPTSRIELIDQSGFSYLLRESLRDLKELPGSPKIPTSVTKSAPSYFSGGSSTKTKGSSKKRSDTGGETELPAQEKAQEAKEKEADTAKTVAGSTDSAPKSPADTGSSTTQSQPVQPSQPSAAQPVQPTQQGSASQSLQAVSAGSSQGSAPAQAAGSQPQGSTTAPSQGKEGLQDRPSNPFQ
jgi:hypothetical protein